LKEKGSHGRLTLDKGASYENPTEIVPGNNDDVCL